MQSTLVCYGQKWVGRAPAEAFWASANLWLLRALRQSDGWIGLKFRLRTNDRPCSTCLVEGEGQVQNLPDRAGRMHWARLFPTDLRVRRERILLRATRCTSDAQRNSVPLQG